MVFSRPDRVCIRVGARKERRDEEQPETGAPPEKINETDSFTHLARHTGLDLTNDGSSLPTKGRGRRENWEDLRETQMILSLDNEAERGLEQLRGAPSWMPGLGGIFLLL